MTAIITAEQAAREIAATNLRLLEQTLERLDSGDRPIIRTRDYGYGTRVVQSLGLPMAFPRTVEDLRTVAAAGREMLDSPPPLTVALSAMKMTRTRHGSFSHQGRITVDRRADLGVTTQVESFDSDGIAYVTVIDHDGRVIATIRIEAPNA